MKLIDANAVIRRLEEKIEEAEKIIVEPPADLLDKVANEAAEAFIEAYKDAIEIVNSQVRVEA